MTLLLDPSIAATWCGKRIFVVGDVMLDHFVYGQVERVSPEAPIPVLHFQSERFMLGGAANVARNISTLGGYAILFGMLGHDAAGDRIAGPLSAEDQIEGLFIRSVNTPTTVKMRYVCGSQQIMRLDVEKKYDADNITIQAICDRCLEVIGSVDAVVLSDYAKGFLTPPVIACVVAAARASGIPVIVDPKTQDVRRYHGASILTPNMNEASVITGLDCRHNELAAESARQISRLAGVDSVVLTRGAQGMTIYDPAFGDGAPIHVSTAASEVFDVSGAGDTVTATLALAVSAGLDVVSGARIANIAAGIVVGKRGTAVVRAPELVRALRRVSCEHDPKIAHPEGAEAIVAEWKEQGLRVGFTNGCFDLLHAGHVELLKRSRGMCDRLVVALNSDSSVRRLKGETRPVQEETARLAVMASLGCVDLVTLFHEDTPIQLIERLQPDLLIKGADYEIDQVIGAKFVQSHGGKVVLVPLKPGHSTTSIISRANMGARL